jgi:hypothetical protein
MVFSIEKRTEVWPDAAFGPATKEISKLAKLFTAKILT